MEYQGRICGLDLVLVSQVVEKIDIPFPLSSGKQHYF